MSLLHDFFKENTELLPLKPEVEKIIETIIDTYRNAGKVLICGNGGSCADADHIVGELMKGFCKKRSISNELKAKLSCINHPLSENMRNKLQTPLSAINLCGHTALTTAFSNDVDPDLIYAQQVLGYADKGDVFIGISTSGNANNVNSGAIVAKALGAVTLGFTGEHGGEMNGLYDIILKVPEHETYKIQEIHIKLYHLICLEVENYFFSE